jgi:thioredoxin-dependent peroxiredoxin
MLKENDVAPDFTLPDQDGKAVSLSDFRGRKVVLYFYSKDDTSGCTLQACDLRDRAEEFGARDAVVLGVSPDPPTSHTTFRQKYDLPFTLLADVEHSVAARYGVWVEKTNYGRTSWGNERTTFVIGEDGRIVRILPRVKPAEHAAQVLQLI